MSRRPRTLAASLALILSAGAGTAYAAPPVYRIILMDLPDGWGPTDYLEPLALNNAGTVMGSIVGDDVVHVFRFREPDGILDLEAGFCCYATPYAMNAKSEITGSDDAGDAFVFRNGRVNYLSSDHFILNDAVDINDKGQIIGAGLAVDDQGNPTNFFSYVWQDGVTTTLPNGPYSYLNVEAINNEGVIAGTGNFVQGGPHPFIFRSGAFTDLIANDSRFDQGNTRALSDTGYVAGVAGLGSHLHAFLFKQGPVKDLGTLGGDRSQPEDVNNSGMVVGSAETSEMSGENAVTHAFLYDGKAMRDLSPVGSVGSRANDITNNGQACGVYFLGDFSRRAFIYSVDDARTINVNNRIDASDPSKPYVVLNECIAMNEFGQLVATGGDSRDRTRRSFLLSPVDSTPPVVSANIEGTQGLRKWYTSAVTVRWDVADADAPVGRKSGCGKTVVSTDTRSQEVRCTAASVGGSTTGTAIVKKDSNRPTVTIMRPASGTVFERNQVVTADFRCGDATSGILSCVGTVDDGSRIDTTRKVVGATFRVKATDKAGLTRLLTTIYSVK